MVMDDVDPGANLVLTMGPSDVMGRGKTPVIAEGRVPSLWIADVCIPGDGEIRKAAAAKVRTVRTRNSEHVRSDVDTEVRGLTVFTHASKADIAVDDEVRRKGQYVAHGDQLYERMEVTQSTITCTVSNRLAQTGFTMKHRLHGAIFCKQGVFASADPIDLAIKIVTGEALRSRTEKVGSLAG